MTRTTYSIITKTITNYIRRIFIFIISDKIGKGLKFGLSWYNCFSFGNGLESNRIKDGFNEIELVEPNLTSWIHDLMRFKFIVIFPSLGRCPRSVHVFSSSSNYFLDFQIGYPPAFLTESTTVLGKSILQSNGLKNRLCDFSLLLAECPARDNFSRIFPAIKKLVHHNQI